MNMNSLYSTMLASGNLWNFVQGSKVTTRQMGIPDFSAHQLFNQGFEGSEDSVMFSSAAQHFSGQNAQVQAPIYYPAPGTEGFAFGKKGADGTTIPWKKEGTYSPTLLFENHTVWTTEKSCYQVIDGKGQIISSGSEGSYQEILEHPERFPMEAALLGLNIPEETLQSEPAGEAGTQQAAAPLQSAAEKPLYKGDTTIDPALQSSISTPYTGKEATPIPALENVTTGDAGRFSPDSIDFQDALLGVAQYNPTTGDRLTHNDNLQYSLNADYKGMEGQVLDLFNNAYGAYINAGQAPETAFGSATDKLAKLNMISIGAVQGSEGSQGASETRDSAYYKDSAAPYLAEYQASHNIESQLAGNPELQNLYQQFMDHSEKQTYMRRIGGVDRLSELSFAQSEQEIHYARMNGQQEALQEIQGYLKDPSRPKPEWMEREGVDYRGKTEEYRNSSQGAQYDEIYMNEYMKQMIGIFSDGQVPDVKLTPEQREEFRYNPTKVMNELFNVQAGGKGAKRASDDALTGEELEYVRQQASIIACNKMMDLQSLQQ